MEEISGIPPQLPAKVDALGLWDGCFTTVLQHRRPVFHKLSQGRRGKLLVLDEAETVFALLRTTFALFEVNSFEPVTAEGILRGLIERMECNRLLKVHVYLAVVAMDKTPEPLSKEPIKYQNKEHRSYIKAHFPQKDEREPVDQPLSHDDMDAGSAHDTGFDGILPFKDDSQSHVGSNRLEEHVKSGYQQTREMEDSELLLDEVALGGLSKALSKTEIRDAKVAPCEVMHSFRSICGVIYPVEPLTVEEPLFSLSGTRVYATTADALCTDLLQRIPRSNKEDTTLPVAVDKDDIKESSVLKHFGDDFIVAVSNFDSVYFLHFG
ncbi:hypothetical protein BgAZ_106720 [Babesia gibsoni]|uniref:Uncharacterized protein n=1 Tax=Babesia gibsoni TaxID=33632 RepID=A0AAD8PG85_BABGI|nr:hypothetical protein BgAZ_106720 [Babesia gibsoni]